MRFLLSLTFIFIISLNTFSQGWLDCGIKGGFGGSALVNSNVWKNSTVEHLLSPAYTFGIKGQARDIYFNLKLNLLEQMVI